MSGNEHVSQAQEVGAGMPEPFIAAAAKFGALLHAAWPSPEAERTVAAAYAGYASVLQDAWQAPEVSQRAADRYSAYTKSVQEAFAGENARQRVMDAFRGYIEDLQRAWSQLDPECLTPERLAAISENAAWVSGVAAIVSQARVESP